MLFDLSAQGAVGSFGPRKAVYGCSLAACPSGAAKALAGARPRFAVKARYPLCWAAQVLLARQQCRPWPALRFGDCSALQTGAGNQGNYQPTTALALKTALALQGQWYAGLLPL